MTLVENKKEKTGAIVRDHKSKPGRPVPISDKAYAELTTYFQSLKGGKIYPTADEVQKKIEEVRNKHDRTNTLINLPPLSV